MNYKRIYESLIQFRTTNIPEGYSEKHHILPRSLGGSDDTKNLVKLTAREHFIAHRLLTKIYKSGPNHHKMVHALSMMFCQSPTHDRYVPSRKFEFLKKQIAFTLSITQSGTGNSQFGTVWMHHDIFGPIKVTTDNIPEYIDQGWFLGRSFKYCKIKVPKQVILENNRKKLELKYPNLQEWYEIYSKVGFEEFVRQTGYNHSKPNLVRLFSRHVESFKPQNGKKRGN